MGKKYALECDIANIYFLSFQQHSIFIIIITENAGGCEDLTASKMQHEKSQHVLVDKHHFRPRDDVYFALLSINEHFCAFLFVQGSTDFI